ncbi:uncharacterized protein KZ484_021384 isoform 2-T2 [Pholidichthys leucotaenia]
MTLKNRKFSLDSFVCVEGGGSLGRQGSGRFHRQHQSLDDGRSEIQERKYSLASNGSFREQIISEENLEPSDGLINHHNNKSFHKLFLEIPEGEHLTHTFTCALQKEVLYHGKLFVSENHVCFHSSVLLKDTKVVIPLSSVRAVKKQNLALSILSIQTGGGEKYSFVSLRNREMCYKLLQTICLHAKGESANSSARLSSGENDADLDLPSSYSSLDDCVDTDLSRISLDESFRQMSTEGPSRSNSIRQNSVTDEEDKLVPETLGVTERVVPVFSFTAFRNPDVLFYIYLMLLVLLLCASAYIGLRMVALQEQLNSVEGLADFPSHQ